MEVASFLHSGTEFAGVVNLIIKLEAYTLCYFFLSLPLFLYFFSRNQLLGVNLIMSMGIPFQPTSFVTFYPPSHCSVTVCILRHR